MSAGFSSEGRHAIHRGGWGLFKTPTALRKIHIFHCKVPIYSENSRSKRSRVTISQALTRAPISLVSL